jgi:hypothetical protein
MPNVLALRAGLGAIIVIVVEAAIWKIVGDLSGRLLAVTVILGVIALLNLKLAERRPYRRRFDIASWGLVGLYVVVVALAALWAVTENADFRAEPRVVFNSSPVRDRMTMFGFRWGPIVNGPISPIPFLIYLQVTNLQAYPAQIVDFSAEIAHHRFGPWWHLPTIALTEGQIYLVGFPGLVASGDKLLFPRGTYLLATPVDPSLLARSILITPDLLFENEVKRPIRPHESVKGWVAFDHARDYEVFRGPGVYFRVTISDSAGVTARSVFPTPIGARGSGELGAPTLTPNGTVRNLSSSRIAPYTEFVIK